LARNRGALTHPSVPKNIIKRVATPEKRFSFCALGGVGGKLSWGRQRLGRLTTIPTPRSTATSPRKEWNRRKSSECQLTAIFSWCYRDFGKKTQHGCKQKKKA